jgi:hypothetical protein
MSQTENRGGAFPARVRRQLMRWLTMSGFAAEVPSLRAPAEERAASFALASSLKRWGDAALRESDALAPGDNYVVAIRLYRDALCCAAGAADGREAESSAGVLSAFPRATALAAAGTESALGDVDSVLRASVSEIAALAPVDRRDRAFALKNVCDAVIRDAAAGSDAVARGVLARPVRMALTTFFVAGLATFGHYSLHAHGDLARGKSWRTSSSEIDCRPIDLGGCAPRQGVYFHTKQDDNPWIEYDLGASAKFTKVVVENARDGFLERAVPLVIEVSDDQKTWKEIARNASPFQEWISTFPVVAARYVRFRVNRVSYLHLARIEIRK